MSTKIEFFKANTYNNEDVEEFLSDSENSLLQKMNTSIDVSMDDATELIEKQEIL